MKAIAILFALVSLLSCRPTQVVTERVTKDSIIVREVPREIIIPPAVTRSPSINLDSLVQVIQSGVKPEVINRTLIQRDTASGMQASLILDELGNLTALCEQQEKVIEYLEKELTHWKSEFEKQIHHQPPTLRQQIQNFILHFIIFAAVVIAIILLLTRR
jgi:hypothetical protein